MTEELLEIVDKEGNTLGVAPRSAIHGNPALIHKVAHVLVFNDGGSLLLQERSLSKDVAPGKWDTSVGGHISHGEDILEAACREMEEELGVAPEKLNFLYSYIHSNAYESELVFTYHCVANGPFSFNRDEINSVRFWTLEEIKKAIGAGVLSDNFEEEFSKYLEIS